MANKEISELKQILGLQQSKDYTDPNTLKTLRYGHLMLMTDQDHDGSHIKGLIINFIHCYWPSLLQHHDFLREFVTPIVKVTHVPAHRPADPTLRPSAQPTTLCQAHKPACDSDQIGRAHV